MKNICIVAPTVEHLTYTIARAVATHNVCVYVLTTPKEAVSYKGHSFYYDRISAIHNAYIMIEPKPIHWDWMYFQIMPELSKFDLADLVRQASNVGILSACRKSSYPRTLWHEFKEVLKYFPVISKCKRVLFLEGYYSLDLYSLIACKQPVGFDVHSNFLSDEALNQQMFSFTWQPKSDRKYKFNFIGNQNPQERTQILAIIKTRLNQWKQTTGISFNEETSLWIEYGDDPNQARGVPAQTFIQYLEDSDFTLCPPGYSKLTHRVVEALVKGSIPILNENELELYDVNLEHGVNCIAVKQSNWPKAIDMAIDMSPKRIHQMRSNILCMKDEFLSEQAFSNKLRRKMVPN